MTAFEHDLFISYAHIDNRPLTPEQEGWISRFHRSLEALLSMRLGKKARVWRDDKLEGNDVFAEEIVEQFDRTAVLVSVLTPRYLKSSWCTREMGEFCDRAERSGGLVISRKARVFKVLKTPVDSEETLPQVVQGLLGYEFFTMDGGAPLELDGAYGERFAQDYNRKVNKLAFEICRLLETLEADGADGDEADEAGGANGNGTTAAAPAADPAPAGASDGEAVSRDTTPASAPGAAGRGDGPHRTVYLAECAYDLRETREIIETELVRLGHAVLPDRQMPREEDDYVAALEELLPRADLVVQLVGALRGAVPGGPSGKSVSELQNERAAARARDGALSRIVWLAEGTRSDDAAQQTFIESLHTDADAQRGADLVTADLEHLRRSILAALEPPRAAPSPVRADEDGDGGASGESGAEVGADAAGPTVHLVCTERDRKATVPLRRLFRQRDIEVTLPAFEGEASAVRETNRRLLADCDAVVLWYGEGEEAWKRTVDSELRKLPVYRGGRALPPVYTCLAAPRTPDKEDLVELEEPRLIDAVDGLDEGALAPLVAALGREPEPA